MCNFQIFKMTIWERHSAAQRKCGHLHWPNLYQKVEGTGKHRNILTLLHRLLRPRTALQQAWQTPDHQFASQHHHPGFSRSVRRKGNWKYACLQMSLGVTGRTCRSKGNINLGSLVDATARRVFLQGGKDINIWCRNAMYLLRKANLQNNQNSR